MTHPASTPSDSSALVSRFLSRLALAPRQAHKALTVWPLVPTSPGPAAPAYGTLSDAIASGTLVVEELPGATVPHVAVENRGELAVLVLFGEQIQGALQNRTVNASFLIPPRARVDIDVSCTEVGRWTGRGAFKATSELVAHAIRRKMAKAVSGSRKRGQRFDANQREVWSEVDHRLDSSRIGSNTRAYADYVAARRSELASAAAAFHPVPGQVGFVAAIGSEVVGVEAIGRPEVFAAAFSGLLQAYLIDAVDAAAVSAREEAAAVRFESPEDFLAALAAAPGEEGPSLGTGRDVRIEGDRVCGCVLVAGDVVHLTAFPEQAPAV
jgi:hypothetical protein